MVAVRRIDPQGVLIDVPVPVQPLEGGRAVPRLVHALVDHVHGLGVVRIDPDLAEVHRSPVLVAAELPGRAPVGRAPDPVVLIVGRQRLVQVVQALQLRPLVVAQRLLAVGRNLDLRVHDVRIGGGGGQRDPPHRSARQPVAAQPRPGVAAVVGAPDAAAGPPADEAACRPSPLVGGREEGVGVGGMQDEVGRARVVVHAQHVAPGAAPVDGLEYAAFGVGPEEATVRRDPRHVGIARVRDHARDRLRLAQPRVREGLAAVGGLVDPVAERRTLPVVGLAGAHPHDVRVGRRDRDVAHRVRPVAVEDGTEGGPVVRGLPEPSRREADEVGVGVLRVDREVIHPAALPERPDRPPRERPQYGVVALVHQRLFGLLGEGGAGCGGGGEECERECGRRDADGDHWNLLDRE